MTKITFPDEFFDGILSYYSIIHVPRDEQYDLLSSFYRILKVDGVVLLTFHLTDDPKSYRLDFFGGGVKMYWSGFEEKVNLSML